MGVDLVRRATDKAVLDALLTAGRLTRAEIATAAGVSKPTASESVRRLVVDGVLEQAGRQEGGRGRTGVYYRVAGAAGLALAVHAGAGSIVGECVDAAGGVVHAAERRVGVTIEVERLARELAAVLGELEARVGRPVGGRALAVADPVDLDGRLVHLPGSPFVLGDGDLRAVVGEGADVDNDVNWAARAELAAGAPASFLYVHLGAGLGAAVVEGGEVVRGRGVAGEIGYVLVADSSGIATPLLHALADLGLCVPDTTTLDVDRVRVALAAGSPDADRAAVIGPLAGALASCAALLDPGAIVVGGPWGPDALDAGLADAVGSRTHRPAPLRAATVQDAPLVGVRLRARELARAALLGPAAGE